MVISHMRACSACHAAKVKCVKLEGAFACKRCERLGIKCVEHVSRQGQGTRRRKKVKTKVVRSENTVDEALAIASSLVPICTSNNHLTPFCPTSGNIVDCGGQTPIICSSNTVVSCQTTTENNNHGSKNGQNEGRLCTGMDSLEIEDSLICKSITNGMGRDHFGLQYLIREWVSLAFSRRSFSLLARASFVAAKMKIPMDDIISNQSSYAAATGSEPMEFLARDMLLPKSERKTLGYPISLLEVPWDLLQAVQIDPHRTDESVRNRWIGIRWTSKGISRFWASPLFARDFATVEEIGQVYEENSSDKEVIDLFLPKSEKGKFAQEIFNLIFVNNRPNMGCFVVKNPYKVLKRNNPDPIEVNVIQSTKIIDLDSQIHYFEMQGSDRNNDRNYEQSMGDNTSNVNKREHDDTYDYNLNDDPIMDDGIEFTDIAMTEEMEEFLKLINGS